MTSLPLIGAYLIAGADLANTEAELRSWLNGALCLALVESGDGIGPLTALVERAYVHAWGLR